MFKFGADNKPTPQYPSVGGKPASTGNLQGSTKPAAGNTPPDALAYGWLRTKGHDDGKITAAIAGSRIQQLRPWNDWWTVLTMGSRTGSFSLKCYTDETLANWKASFGSCTVDRRAPLPVCRDRSLSFDAREYIFGEHALIYGTFRSACALDLTSSRPASSQEDLTLGAGAAVTVLDSEAAVIAAGLKPKHFGKQLLRVCTGKQASLARPARARGALFYAQYQLLSRMQISDLEKHASSFPTKRLHLHCPPVPLLP